jgi:hypothetical protein
MWKLLLVRDRGALKLNKSFRVSRYAGCYLSMNAPHAITSSGVRQEFDCPSLGGRTLFGGKLLADLLFATTIYDLRFTIYYARKRRVEGKS